MYCCEHLAENPNQPCIKWLFYWFCENCWERIKKGEEKIINISMCKLQN